MQKTYAALIIAAFSIISAVAQSAANPNNGAIPPPVKNHTAKHVQRAMSQKQIETAREAIQVLAASHRAALGNPASRRLKPQTLTENYDNNYIWAGNVFVSEISGTVQGVLGGSYVPTTATCPYNAYGNPGVAIWTGLDGWSPATATVEQAGIFMQCFQDGTTAYTPWWEDYVESDSPTNVIDIAVAAGDYIEIAVSASLDSSTDLPDGTYYILFYNFTAASDYYEYSYASAVFTNSAASAQSAEWIIESVASGYHTPLIDFGTSLKISMAEVNIYDPTTAGTGDYYEISGDPVTLATSYNPSNWYYLANITLKGAECNCTISDADLPGALTGSTGGFKFYWFGYQ